MSEAGAEGLVERLRDERHCNDWYLRQEAAAALEAQGRALAEAGAENERKTRDIEVKARILSRMAKAITGIERQRDEALEALRPFAAFAKYWDGLQSPDDRKFISVGDACKLTVGDVRRARSALEMLAASNPQSTCAGEEAGQSAGEVQQQRNASPALAPSKVLENSKAGLADANQTKSPSSQDQEIAGLREELRRKDAAARKLLAHLDRYDFNERDPSGELYDRMSELSTALSPLDGEA